MKSREFMLIVLHAMLSMAWSNPQEAICQNFELSILDSHKNSNCSRVNEFLPSNFVLKCNLVAKKGTRDDYHYVSDVGQYKLHTRAKTWNEARKVCNEEGAHLAIINSVTEAKVLVDLFHRAGHIKGGVNQYEGFLGIHDLYMEGEWVTIEGDSLEKTGFNSWSEKWGGQPDNAGGIQNCGVLVADDGKLDDVACNIPLAFFCEAPL